MNLEEFLDRKAVALDQMLEAGLIEDISFGLSNEPEVGWILNPFEFTPFWGCGVGGPLEQPDRFFRLKFLKPYWPNSLNQRNVLESAKAFLAVHQGVLKWPPPLMSAYNTVSFFTWHPRENDRYLFVTLWPGGWVEDY